MNSRLSHLADGFVAASTAAAYQRDLRYFWAWARASYGVVSPAYPISLEWLRVFVTDQLSGLEPTVCVALQSDGFQVHGTPRSPRTVRRYLASLSVEHAMRGIPNPCRDSGIALLLRRRQRRTAKRVQHPITADVCTKLLSVCGCDLRGLRDRALLLVGFAGGGRRRSELVSLRIQDLEPVADGFLGRLGHHKTAGVAGTVTFPIFGEASDALALWLARAGITSGFVFRGITRNEKLMDSMNGRTVNRIVKQLARKAGLNPADFGAHSLRSGFMTEAGRAGIPIGEAMAVSGHRSLTVALGYHKTGEVHENRAAHLAPSLTQPNLPSLNSASLASPTRH